MTLVGAWTTPFFPSEKNFFGANIRIPARIINGTVIQPRRHVRLLERRRAGDVRPGLRHGRLHRERPDEPDRGDRRRDLLGVDDDVQRGGAGRLPDPRARQPRVLHQPLPAGPRRDRVEDRWPRLPEHAVPERHAYALYIRGMAGSTFVRFEIYSKPLGRSVSFTKPRSATFARRSTPSSTRPSSSAARRSGPRRRPTARTSGSPGPVRDASGRTLHVDRWFSHYVRVDGVLQIGTG
jgi:hypothetical protein